MLNVNELTSRMAKMSDDQLRQYAQLHKNDPYTLALAASESKRRAQLRASGQTQAPQRPTVADQTIAQMGAPAPTPQQAPTQLPEEQGIGVLPEQSLAQMADGGIAGYAEGGPVSFAGGGTEKAGRFDPDTYLQNPNVQKFLQYLNVYEGSPQANQLVGFKEFKGFDDHPRTPVVFNKKGAKSDAAGLFQIKGATWDYQSKKLGLTDFSPDNQKRAAIGILKDIKALPDIVQGNFEAAKAKAAKQWASLPGSTIGKATGQNPRFKPEAEAILGQPVREARNQPAQNPPAQKTQERTLGQRLFDILPFSNAGAANSKPTNKQTFSAIPPINEEFYTRLEAAKADYQKLYGRELPVTSLGRTRYEQQGLRDKKQKGGPGSEKIYTPVNPENYPGREVFHMNAADISSSVSEAFMRKHGLYRPDPKGDPVHYVAMPNWKPEEGTRTAAAKPAPAPAPVVGATPSAVLPVQRQNDVARTQDAVAQTRISQGANNQATPSAVLYAQRDRVTQTPVASQTRISEGIPSLISSANAAPTSTSTSTSASAPTPASDFSPENTNVPILSADVADYIRRLRDYEAAQNRPAPAPAPAPKAVRNAAERDDVVFSPEGFPIAGGVAYDAGPKTESPVTSMLTGTADVFLGIPEAIANVVMRNYYNLPFGTEYTWEQASQAAGDNPIVKAAGYLRSGKWFGVENDPAYRKDPLSVITSLPSLGVKGIAKKFGINEEAAQLALDNALLLAPVVKKAGSGKWQVEANLPKREKPPAPTDASMAQLKAETAAAVQKVDAPRLEAPKPSNAIEVTPGGIATLPKNPRPSETPAARGLAEDRARADALIQRLQAAEEARAAAAKEGAPGAAEAFLAAHPWTAAGVNVAPYAVLSGGADFSNTSVSPASAEDVNAQFNAAYKYGDKYTYTPEAVDQAKKVAEEVTTSQPSAETTKPSGFSNEDILLMGLNMMAQPRQPGGKLSQFLGSVGRSGIATLQAKREREKLAQDRAFKDLYGKYIEKQTNVMGRPTGEEAVIERYAKDKNISFADAYEEISGFKSRNAYIQAYYKQAADPLTGEAFKAKYPHVDDYLRSEGIVGYQISPRATDAMNKVLGPK